MLDFLISRFVHSLDIDCKLLSIIIFFHWRNSLYCSMLPLMQSLMTKAISTSSKLRFSMMSSALISIVYSISFIVNFNQQVAVNHIIWTDELPDSHIEKFTLSFIRSLYSGLYFRSAGFIVA